MEKVFGRARSFSRSRKERPEIPAFSDIPDVPSVAVVAPWEQFNIQENNEIAEKRRTMRRDTLMAKEKAPAQEGTTIVPPWDTTFQQSKELAEKRMIMRRHSVSQDKQEAPMVPPWDLNILGSKNATEKNEAAMKTDDVSKEETNTVKTATAASMKSPTGSVKSVKSTKSNNRKSFMPTGRFDPNIRPSTSNGIVNAKNSRPKSTIWSQNRSTEELTTVPPVPIIPQATETVGPESAETIVIGMALGSPTKNVSPGHSPVSVPSARSSGTATAATAPEAMEPSRPKTSRWKSFGGLFAKKQSESKPFYQLQQGTGVGSAPEPPPKPVNVISSLVDGETPNPSLARPVRKDSLQPKTEKVDMASVVTMVQTPKAKSAKLAMSLFDIPKSEPIQIEQPRIEVSEAEPTDAEVKAKTPKRDNSKSKYRMSKFISSSKAAPPEVEAPKLELPKASPKQDTLNALNGVARHARQRSNSAPVSPLPFLDIDIPHMTMDRYSIMFSSVLNPIEKPNRSSTLFARRQSRLAVLGKPIKEPTIQTEEAKSPVGVLKRPRGATSPLPIDGSKSPSILLSLFPTPGPFTPKSPKKMNPLSSHPPKALKRSQTERIQHRVRFEGLPTPSPEPSPMLIIQQPPEPVRQPTPPTPEPAREPSPKPVQRPNAVTAEQSSPTIPHAMMQSIAASIPPTNAASTGSTINVKELPQPPASPPSPTTSSTASDTESEDMPSPDTVTRHKPAGFMSYRIKEPQWEMMKPTVGAKEPAVVDERDSIDVGRDSIDAVRVSVAKQMPVRRTSVKTSGRLLNRLDSKGERLGSPKTQLPKVVEMGNRRSQRVQFVEG